MQFSNRLASCAFLLASIAPIAHAGGSGGKTYNAAIEAARTGNLLSTRLASGWTAAVNLNRGKPQGDGRPWAPGTGRRGLMLSLSRKF